MGHILAIDQGTTGSTAALINDENWLFLGQSNREYPQHYPRPGLVEHDLEDIWKSVQDTIVDVLKKYNVSPRDISAIGITNQRETTCAFDKKGNPLARAIVWQDRRTHNECLNLKKRKLEPLFAEKTGLPLDPYFSGSKMQWLLNNDEFVKKAAKDNNLLFGTIDTFLLHRLTDGKSFATEDSNACRTLLMNIKTGSWDTKLLEIFGVSRDFLPPIKESFGFFGTTKNMGTLPDGIPISGILGDQQAALFGQAGYTKGSMKCTYGTGAFILFNTGNQPVLSKNGLLTTIAYNYKGKRVYALEGSAYIAGAAVQWLRDNLNIIESSSDVESLARQVKSDDEMEHILFLPFFTGIGSPYWNAQAKAAIIGLTRDSGPSHIAKACLDGIVLSIDDLLDSIKSDTNLNISAINVDGGAVVNNLLMQNQSTLSQVDIIRPSVIETTAYGAALAAGVGANKITFEQIPPLWKKEKTFHPQKRCNELLQEKKAAMEGSYCQAVSLKAKFLPQWYVILSILSVLNREKRGRQPCFKAPWFLRPKAWALLCVIAAHNSQIFIL